METSVANQPAGTGSHGQQTGIPDSALSDRQLRILQAIDEHVAQHGYPPSMREIGREVGLTSVSSVSYQLTQLEEMGRIESTSNRSRTYRITGKSAAPTSDNASAEAATPTPDTAVHAQLLGRIAAGPPITAEQEVAGIVVFPVRSSAPARSSP